MRSTASGTAAGTPITRPTGAAPSPTCRSFSDELEHCQREARHEHDASGSVREPRLDQVARGAETGARRRRGLTPDGVRDEDVMRLESPLQRAVREGSSDADSSNHDAPAEPAARPTTTQLLVPLSLAALVATASQVGICRSALARHRLSLRRAWLAPSRKLCARLRSICPSVAISRFE